VNENIGEVELGSVGEDVGKESTGRDDPAPAAFGVVVLLQGPPV